MNPGLVVLVRCSVVESTMETLRVVESAVVFCQDLRLEEMPEDGPVSQLARELAHERFRVTILPGAARLNESGLRRQVLQKSTDLSGYESGARSFPSKAP